MEFHERPLLNFPDLMLAILRVAGQGSATLDAAAELVLQGRETAHEGEPVPRNELMAHLDDARFHAEAAHLIEVLPEGRFRITPRGKAVLRQNPDGIDDTVLMQYPEFGAWVARRHAHAPPEDARNREFQRGWLAHGEGQPLTGNPFAPDTAQHAAWEDGWLEGGKQRDE
ncbi:MAG: hypothetical protein ACM33T_09055 [Solirubrobacterales bacterium]